MFDNLSERLERSFKILKGEGRITEINIAETVKDIRKALLEADVNYKTAKQFTDQVKEKALGQNVITAVRPGQLMVKITHDELAELMGGEAADINLKGTPAVILMSGLQGSGKTTFASKLANYLQTKKGKRVMLVACDVYRPAAIEQLRILGEQINAKVYTEETETNPVKKAQNAIAEARKFGYDVVIVDTAGRLAVDEQMMQEIAAIKQAIQPSETLFVVDAMTGQDAVNTAKTFNDRIDFDGVVLTKLDGDARGGAALSIRSVVNKPIKFIGTGEKTDDFEPFHPDRIASRILGMGDIVSLVEKAQQTVDEEEAKKLQAKLARNEFTLNDMLAQFENVGKMGSVSSLLDMIPGLAGQIDESKIDLSGMKKQKAIIQAMTQKERNNHLIIGPSRRKRIAKGSGTSVAEVNKLIKQFEKTKLTMKKLTKNRGMQAKLMQGMAGMGGGFPGGFPGFGR